MSMEARGCSLKQITLQPLRFMELALEAPIPATLLFLLGSTSAIVVNLPAPAAYAGVQVARCRRANRG